MRKTAIYIFILCVQTALFAEHPAGIGLGLVAGGGYSGGTGVGTTALSFKLPRVPVFWECDFSLSSVFFLNLHGDYYIIDSPLSPALKLGWYCGAGLTIGLALYKSETAFSCAARIPLGLSWYMPSKPDAASVELFLEFIPAVGFLVSDTVGWNYTLGAALGVRLWIKAEA
ncbi:MAG: hypothetical protein LBO67_09280 [Spirochaetaceae bacterium]|jgi:hypothetical protein|nr:hypothetical protein [Spirochaetaceae bacterium]